jgi:coenzyme F420 hydrogenase subunit beta
MYNSLHISRTKDDVLKNASSRYAPALVLHNISEILSETNEKFVFVGKPCDITAIKNYLERYPQYKSKIYYYISIFCAGIPSYNATEILLKNAEKETEPLCVKYRGDGWPGNFEAQYQDGYIFRKSYNESWGQVLGKNIHFRCKICPDGIGLFADIVAADSWETKDGYPDFEEKEGKSFVISRNAQGEELLKNAINSNYIKVEELNINDIKYIQPYQYRKRYEVGFRILGIQLCTFFSLRFLNFRLVNRMSQYNYLKGIKIVLGTIKRHIQKT